MGIADIGLGIIQDIQDYNNYGKSDGYHSALAFGKFSGAYVVGCWGVNLGVFFGGLVGDIPGAMIGGFALGGAGSVLGEKLGENLVESYYRENNLFIP